MRIARAARCALRCSAPIGSGRAVKRIVWSSINFSVSPSATNARGRTTATSPTRARRALDRPTGFPAGTRADTAPAPRAASTPSAFGSAALLLLRRPVERRPDADVADLSDAAQRLDECLVLVDLFHAAARRVVDERVAIREAHDVAQDEAFARAAVRPLEVGIAAR